MLKRVRRRSGTDPAELILGSHPRVRPLLGVAVTAGTVGALCVVGIALVIATVVSRVFQGGADLGAVGPLLVLGVLLASLRGGLLLIQELTAQRASTHLRGVIRRQVLERLRAIGPIGLGRERSGELVTTMSRGLEDIDGYLTGYRPARQLAAIVPIMVVGVVLLLDPPTAMVLLVTGPVLVLLLAVIGSRTRIVSDRRSAELRWLGGFFLDMLQGLTTLRLFGRGGEQVETIRQVSRQYGETTMEVLRTAFQTALVLEWSAAVATAVVAVEVSLRLMDRQIPFERALGVLIITPECFLPLRQLALRYHSGAAGRAAAERIRGLLGSDEGAAASTDPGVSQVPELGRDAPLPPVAGDVRFEGVWVGYDDRGPVLRGLDLVLHQGTITALVGPTGAGKSTLASLLLRWLTPGRGRLTIDGVDLTTIDRAVWARSVAWVPQRPHLFHGTIADNLRLGAPGTTDAQLRAMVQDIGLTTLIDALPLGLATLVGEDGLRLSGGQRQRVALGRALLTDAPLLVLDEATAHLDPVSEAALGALIRSLTPRRSVLLITHRAALAAIADRSVTLANGRIEAA